MIEVYCDGSSRGNPGPGGYGVIILGQNTVVEFGGRSDMTTNNIMELTAAIEAIRFIDSIPTQKPITIHTDSQYVINGITSWIHNWKKNNWRTSTRKPVLNEELWKQLDAVSSKHSITWKYVRGHNGDPGNERADTIACAYADNDVPILYKGQKQNYAF